MHATYIMHYILDTDASDEISLWDTKRTVLIPWQNLRR
jgi:hypothetical protein